jgi:superfamily I DNA/RNA helicase
MTTNPAFQTEKLDGARSVLALTRWSSQQTSIFDWFANGEGNLVVRARAGTGKTTTILEAITHAPEGKILLAAFNKKIAEELKSRLKNPKAEAKTLHSLGFGFVVRNWNGTKLDNERGERLARVAAGTSAPDKVVTLVKKLASLGKNAAPYPTVERMVDLAYNHDIDPDPECAEFGWTVEKVAELAIKAMDAALVKDGSIDFDDMIFVPIRNNWVRPRFDLVVIDEAQDMNAAQLLLATKVVTKGGRVAVIGDDRQAIYGFRGADSNSIDRLKGELVAHELGLNITYRCPQVVVEAAAKLVPDYTAAPAAPRGEFMDASDEQMYQMATAGDFILSRKNAPLAAICLHLLAMGKRSLVEGREIGQGLLAVIKKVKGKSIPEFLSKLTKWEKKQVERLRATGKAAAEKKIEYIEDQAATLSVLAQGATSIRELEARVQEMFQETTGGKMDVIVCSSVHKAKGLERNRVFGLVDTLYPGGRKDSIEEQNIHYVMLTRAKQTFVAVAGFNDKKKAPAEEQQESEDAR